MPKDHLNFMELIQTFRRGELLRQADAEITFFGV